MEVHPPHADSSRAPLLYQLQSLLQQLPDVIVQGIPSVERAIVNKAKDKCAAIYSLHEDRIPMQSRFCISPGSVLPISLGFLLCLETSTQY